MAPTKQVTYALSLLAKNGYPTTYMNSRFTELGATMRQRSGTVESWLSKMPSGQISSLITKLQKR